ncbi:MAG: class I SAM-dependent methyltransferase [Gammaproteobacteria bacterium]|nr:MAG: class I SAM-dependent methyltransferase [Gammaproteobacteria bacterium]
MVGATMLASGCALAATLAVSAAYAGHGSARGRVTPPYITRAVGDSARPEADTKRDADRHPALTLAVAGVKPGDQVAELIPGAGYFTRLLSAVVGPRGKVYAVVPPRRPDAPADQPDPAARLQPITSDSHYRNVTVSVQKVAQLELPRGLDLVWTSQNYHDFHNLPDIQVADIDKAVFRALKPGGVYLVLDHAAQAGSGFRDTSTLHRIDPEAVKKEVMSAGFRFEARSDILSNQDDPHTAKVFDPAIRGHTDQFIFKFRKPRT